MKRILYCFLICILACTIGCQKENTHFISIASNEPNTVTVAEPEPAQPAQVTEDKPKETIEEETASYSGEEDIDDYIKDNLVLEDDEEIESCEWVCGDFQSDRCFRVRICYKEEPENEYKHKRDFFVFRERAGLTSIMVDYPSVRDYDAPRHVNETNNFDAVLEDVNFDEYTQTKTYRQLVIHLYLSGDRVHLEAHQELKEERVENHAVNKRTD